MKILYIVPYPPDLIRVRPFNLIRCLTERGHQVTLGTLWTNPCERAHLGELERAGINVIAERLTRVRAVWNCLGALPCPTPLQSVYCWQPQLLKSIQSAIRYSEPRFDLIHVEHLRGAPFGTHIQSADPE